MLATCSDNSDQSAIGRTQREKTAPCGAPSPVQPWGHNCLAKLNPGWPSGPRKALSIVSSPLFSSSLSKYIRWPGFSGVTAKRRDFGSQDVQCGAKSDPMTSRETSAGRSPCEMSSTMKP